LSLENPTLFNMINSVQLRDLPLFHGVMEDSLSLLAEHIDRQRYNAGGMIFKQGEPAERLFILLSGGVVIRYNPPDGDMLDVADISEHHVFGWSAALGRESYTSSAICTVPCEVLTISGSDLRHICQQYPDTGVIILERLAGVIAQRLRNTHDHVMDLLRSGIHPCAP